MKMLNSKKGFKTLITIFAILFIAIAFIFFSYLFKTLGKAPPAVEAQFKSIDTEYTLRTFLSSPSGIEPEELEVAVGDHMSNSQLVARTCDEMESNAFETFRQNAEEYFNNIYGKEENWKLKLLYLKDNGQNYVDLNGESIGKLDIDSALRIYSQYDSLRSSMDNSELSKDKVLYALNIRGSRVGMQLLPCNNENSVVKLILVNNEGKSDIENFWLPSS